MSNAPDKSDLDVMMGNATNVAPKVNSGTSKPKRKEVIATDTLNAKLVVEAQYSGPEYWHFSNIVRATECILGFGSDYKSLTYAVQVRDGKLTIYDREGTELFSGAL